MAAQSPIVTEAPANNGLVKGTLLQAMIERIPYVLGTTEVAADLTQPLGLIYRVIHWQKTGYAYYYVASDTTTPDDGETVLVDFDGHRYHLAASSDIQVNSVLAHQNDPPVSPNAGDAYIVGTSPTGAWVGHANDIAIWLLSGWVFAQPKVGHTLYNQSTNGNLQFDENGDWVGFAVEFSTGVVPNGALEFAFGIAVETTQNAPPGGPSQNLFYIVGNSPSGAWVGHAKDVAEWNGTAWVFYSPYVGATVYHKANAVLTTYTAGGVWAGLAASKQDTFTAVGADIWTKPSFGSMALIEVWGAGGSGGRGGGGDGGGGGGGGSYSSITIPLSLLAATESIVVGAGGAAITIDNTDGNAGGNSTFGAWLTGYGGGGGAGNVTSAGGGGGGGGPGSAGATAVGAGNPTVGGGNGGTDLVGGAGGVGGSTTPTTGDDSLNAGAGGGGASGAAGRAGGDANIGGGGGGGGTDSGTAGSGGDSIHGGAGGGGGKGAGTPGAAGGTSLLGGNGGAGNFSTNAATAGAQPGGGGGGSVSGNSGKGGDGMVRVTVF